MAGTRASVELTSPPAPLRGGEGGRKADGKTTADSGKSTVRMAQNEVVGEAKDPKIRCGKPGITAAITLRFGKVRSSIGLDHKSRFPAEEVDDEGPDGMLSPKLGLHHLPAAHHLPEHPLGLRGPTS